MLHTHLAYTSVEAILPSSSLLPNPDPPYPLTVMTTCIIAWDESDTAKIRKPLVNLSSYCFLNVSVRLFLLTSLPPSFWAEIAHLLFRCRDVPRPIFLYDDFDQVNTTKLDEIRRIQEEHASASRGVFYELHIVRINQSVGFSAPQKCFPLFLHYVLQEPQTATNYFHFLEDDMDYSIANFLSFQQETEYFRSFGPLAAVAFAHGFLRWESYAGSELSESRDPPEFYDPEQHGPDSLWIVGNRIYYQTSVRYSAGWMLTRDQLFFLLDHSSFVSHLDGNPPMDPTGALFSHFLAPLFPFYDAGVWVHHMTNNHLYQNQVPRLLSRIEDKMHCFINGTSCEATIRFFCPTMIELKQLDFAWQNVPQCKLTSAHITLLQTHLEYTAAQARLM